MSRREKIASQPSGINAAEFNRKIDKRKLALAVIQAMQTWSDEHNKPFLQCGEPGELTKEKFEEWFDWFVVAWGVARTIKKENRDEVRNYLYQTFRAELRDGGGAKTVDAAALHIKSSGWSSLVGKSRKRSLPISLVSKVAFFLCPTKFVPYDQKARDGLNSLRGDDKCLSERSYVEYMGAFERQYSRFEAELNSALKEQWVAELANKLGCPTKALTTLAMRRKLFDDYLMHIGGYREYRPQDGNRASEIHSPRA